MGNILKYAKSIFFPKSKKRPILWIGNNAKHEEQCAIVLETMGFHITIAHSVPDMRKTIYPCLVVIDIENVEDELIDFITYMRGFQNIPVLALASIETGSILMNQGVDLCISPSLSPIKIVAYVMALIFQYDDAVSWQDGNYIFPIVQGNIFVDQLNTWVDIDGKPIRLSTESCRLFVFFLQNQERLITYHELRRFLWMNDGLYGRDERVAVDELCAKIEPTPLGNAYIREIPNSGYRFQLSSQTAG